MIFNVIEFVRFRPCHITLQEKMSSSFYTAVPMLRFAHAIALLCFYRHGPNINETIH